MQVISIIFLTCRGWQNFWTPYSRLNIKQALPVPASESIGWSGPWKQHILNA